MSEDLSYKEWVAYCFDREVSGPQWYWGFDEDGDWYQPTPSVLACYLRQLFIDTADHLAGYTEEQIAQGLHFICSGISGYFQIARGITVSHSDQVAWVHAICNLYRDLFSKECSHFYGHLDRGPEQQRPLNTLCYMFWDLDGIEGAAMFPGEGHLVDPIFEVLTCALQQPNPACAESALHGLGHLASSHPERVQAIISAYLASGAAANEELIAYAKNASVGCIQ